jgi:hypothetical protein
MARPRLSKSVLSALAASVLFVSVLMVGCSASLESPADLNRIAGQKGLAVNSADTFRFAVLADRNGGQEVGKWAIAVSEVDRLRPDFVMCIGDLTPGYNDDPQVLAKQWDEFHDENKGLLAPFFYCPGNHDVLGAESRQAYAQRHNVNGHPYYSFNYRDCHFAVIDTTCLVEPEAITADAAIARAQWDWLAKDLAAAKSARHTFIFMHYPLWLEDGIWPKLRAMVDPAKTTLFAGHTHRLEYREVDGVACNTLAVTAAQTKGDRSLGEFQMYAFVTVDAGKPTVTYLPVGSALPLNAPDVAAQAIAQGAVDEATLSSIPVSGGKATLRLANHTKYAMKCELNWLAPASDLAKIPTPKESLTLPVGGTEIRTYDFPAIAAGQAVPKLEIKYSYTLNKILRSAGRQIPLAVLAEYSAKPSGKPALGLTPQIDAPHTDVKAKAHAMPTFNVTYDAKNLYVDISAVDGKILTQGSAPWQKDGVEIFWDPRPADQQDGQFAGPCRQLLIPVPEEGKPAIVFTNPKDDALASAATAECIRGQAGYRIIATIPLTSIGKDFMPTPGQSLRMDVFQDNKDTPEADPDTFSVSGNTESSRKTAHYVFVKFE